MEGVVIAHILSSGSWTLASTKEEAIEEVKRLRYIAKHYDKSGHSRRLADKLEHDLRLVKE